MNTKVMFAGDIHGNLDHAEWLFGHAREQGVNVIIACGDFGYWPHYRWGEKFLNAVAEMAEKNDIKFYWVDGNHENHDLLDDLVETHGADNPIPMYNENMNYIPRGCVFTIGSKKIMGYGGAYSWDWKHRELGLSWWKQELINDYKVDELPEQKVDILVTHEAPLGKQISYKDDIAISVHQRELVSEIQSKVNPALHVCGHHHTRETWNNGDTEVHVLGRDEMEADSVLIIDID
jgi:Icc-related predicted phosphoesterase